MNVGIDTLLGAVPAVGDVFDTAWKSNTKNVALLEHLAGDRAAICMRRRSPGDRAVVVVLVLVLRAGLAGHCSCPIALEPRNPIALSSGAVASGRRRLQICYSSVRF